MEFAPEYIAIPPFWATIFPPLIFVLVVPVEYTPMEFSPPEVIVPPDNANVPELYTPADLSPVNDIVPVVILFAAEVVENIPMESSPETTIAPVFSAIPPFVEYIPAELAPLILIFAPARF